MIVKESLENVFKAKSQNDALQSAIDNANGYLENFQEMFPEFKDQFEYLERQLKQSKYDKIYVVDEETVEYKMHGFLMDLMIEPADKIKLDDNHRLLYYPQRNLAVFLQRSEFNESDYIILTNKSKI